MKVDYDQIIIGAGFSGLGAAIKLKQSGRDNFIVLEKAARIGGTWRDNVYPGCACDVPSHLYSYSFAQNANWSRIFSRQPEILAYMEDCVEQFDLRDKIRCNTAIKSLVFNPKEGCWLVQTEAGDQLKAQTVLLGLGPLNVAKIPPIKGRESFTGTQFHTSKWQTDHDLRGKRVAIIGTGASAIQVIPEIAPVVKELFVFQRTPPWVGPRPDKAISPRIRQLFERIPFLLWVSRTIIYLILEFRGRGLFGNKTLHRWMQRRALRHIRESVSDPDLRKRVTPDYQIGCKRILLSEDYYPALQLPQVELIAEAVECIEGDTLIGKAGTRRSIDTLIYATGFDAASYDKGVEIIGVGGRSLAEAWSESGPEAYLGTTVTGFPNLLFIIGPNTGLGHNSMIHIMESQFNYMLSYLDLLADQDISHLDLKPEVQTAYNIAIQDQLSGMVWSTGCASWYQLDNGKNTTLWPGPTTTFRKRTLEVHAEDYSFFRADTV